MQLHLKEYQLELRHTFTISRESRDFQPTLIVQLIEDNLVGTGEATSNIFYNITVDLMKKDLNAIKSIIESADNETPTEFWDKIYPHLKQDMFALCALDSAYNDLYAKKHKKKLYEL